MIRSTFYGFTTARLGMSSAQKALDLIGQNITNSDTEGYTRQRVEQENLMSHTGLDKYENFNETRIGQGAHITRIAQMRDPFLDIRYREENSKLGREEALLDGLKEVGAFFSEIKKDGLSKEFSDFLNKLQVLHKDPKSPENEAILRASADSLTKLFNHYSRQLEQSAKGVEHEFKNVGVESANQIMKQIADLNKQIRTHEIHNYQPLELYDRRNVLLDKLSSYVDIKYQYNDIEVSKGVTVRDLKVTLARAEDQVLVWNEKSVQFEAKMAQDMTQKNELHIKGKIEEDPAVIHPPGQRPRFPQLNVSNADHNVTNQIQGGSLKGQLAFLNEEGEFDGSETRGVRYYQKTLDVIANKFATEMNALNEEAGGVPKPLFEAKGGGDITAKNIRVSEEWKRAGITGNYVKTGDDKSPNGNVLKFIDAMTKSTRFESGGRTLFEGSFNQAGTQMKTVLDLDIGTQVKTKNAYEYTRQGIADAKDSISGVNFDEEGVNMMKYMKAYNASARMMTTLDDALDTLINKMGVVGR